MKSILAFMFSGTRVEPPDPIMLARADSSSEADMV